MIEVQELTKRYGDFEAIRDVSFSIGKGEIVGFLGPNGAGKTTTMRILSCFMPPTSGSGNIAGYDLFKDSLEVRKRIGYLPEHPPLYPEMTVRAYLLFVATIKGVVARDRKAKLAKVIEQCSLIEVQHRLIGHLSKGYRQRVGIAQALIHDPEVVILDEPTIGLDPAQIIDIRHLIRGLAGERTIILSTHILPEVSMLCSRVIIIHRGRVLASDAYEKLTSERVQGQRLHLKARGLDVERLRSLPGVVSVQSQDVESCLIEAEPEKEMREAVSRYVISQGWGLLELTSQSLSLEEVYLKLISESEGGYSA